MNIYCIRMNTDAVYVHHHVIHILIFEVFEELNSSKVLDIIYVYCLFAKILIISQYSNSLGRKTVANKFDLI